jgi:opacity protein-like surface antigen
MSIMKKHGSSAVLAGVCASALCLASAEAQSNQVSQAVTPPLTDSGSLYPVSRFYVGADAGGVLTGDTRVKQFFGPVDPGTKVSLDPGVRVGFVGGYRLNDWFSLEGETGIMANNIKSITGASIDGDATLANVPFLANVRIQLPRTSRCPVTPFIGGGVGGSASVLAFDHHIDFNGARLRGSDAAAVFAYQAFAGLRYAITDQMGLAVEYHYFATTGPTWRGDGNGGSSDRLSFLGVQSHAVSLAFDFNF